MRVIYKHVKSEASPPGLAPVHPASSPHASGWLLGAPAAVSREPPLNGLSHPDNQQLSALCPLLPPVKGPLQKASFEMRIQVDREGQESSHTCSNDRQVFRLCLPHTASQKGCCGCVPHHPLPMLRAQRQRSVLIGFQLQGPPCSWRVQACLYCCTHAKLRLTYRSLVVREVWWNYTREIGEITLEKLLVSLSFFTRVFQIVLANDILKEQKW